MHADGEVPVLRKIAASNAVGLGQYGATVISDTNEVTGTFAVLHALTDVVFASVTAVDWTGSLATVTLKAGDKLFGNFLSVTLTSGTLVAYNAAT